jgi:hypothetical protein
LWDRLEVPGDLHRLQVLEGSQAGLICAIEDEAAATFWHRLIDCVDQVDLEGLSAGTTLGGAVQKKAE